MSNLVKLFKDNLRYDFSSGLVVFLVALPLCLGIALASNAPLFSGLIAGIVGGIVIGFLSNSHLSVSGPAAGLTAIVVVGLQKLNFEGFLLAVVVAGVIQVIFGLLKAGSLTRFFPSSVITGMLTGIGVIIIMKQIPHAVGYDKDPEGDFSFLQTDGENTFSALRHIVDISAGALVVALVSLLILIVWERPAMKRVVPNFIPGALIVVAAGIILNEIFKATSQYFLIEPKHLVDVPVASSFAGFLNLFKLPDFSQITNTNVYIQGFTIAVVASVETLLCIEAADKLDTQKRTTDTNRELWAQGVGNITSGLLGGLPVTSVIVRTSANANAGARTKFSAILHGFMLLLCAALIPTVLNKIPLSALAAILLMTGYKLAKPTVFKTMFGEGMRVFIPFVVTVLAVVFTDLLKGVAIGTLVAYAIQWLNLFPSPTTSAK